MVIVWDRKEQKNKYQIFRIITNNSMVNITAKLIPHEEVKSSKPKSKNKENKTYLHNSIKNNNNNNQYHKIQKRNKNAATVKNHNVFLDTASVTKMENIAVKSVIASVVKIKEVILINIK